MEETDRKILVVSYDLSTILIKFPGQRDRKFVKISTKKLRIARLFHSNNFSIKNNVYIDFLSLKTGKDLTIRLRRYINLQLNSVSRNRCTRRH